MGSLSPRTRNAQVAMFQRRGHGHLAQRRLGGGRIHHAMRTVAMVKRALAMMCERALSRRTQGEILALLGDACVLPLQHDLVHELPGQEVRLPRVLDAHLLDLGVVLQDLLHRVQDVLAVLAGDDLEVLLAEHAGGVDEHAIPLAAIDHLEVAGDDLDVVGSAERADDRGRHAPEMTRRP